MNDTRTPTTLDLLIEATQRHGMVVSGDLRVSEADAAKLLNYSLQHLRRLRREGSGPRVYLIGLARCSLSYRLHDLASWVDMARDDDRRGHNRA